ncbi:hypothetical protein M0802_004058 [Mischocyttarus mexicanus]|nr:hypothetical protein M0802_016856 [Mischocyttarus mexicanus]KAI4500847.1 hypothetical protein M0802_004058 [Mischocyttarus mexicanus]
MRGVGERRGGMWGGGEKLREEKSSTRSSSSSSSSLRAEKSRLARKENSSLGTALKAFVLRTSHFPTL